MAFWRLDNRHGISNVRTPQVVLIETSSFPLIGNSGVVKVVHRQAL